MLGDCPEQTLSERPAAIVRVRSHPVERNSSQIEMRRTGICCTESSPALASVQCQASTEMLSTYVLRNLVSGHGLPSLTANPSAVSESAG